jgi:hypothetical protein
MRTAYKLLIWTVLIAAVFSPLLIIMVIGEAVMFSEYNMSLGSPLSETLFVGFGIWLSGTLIISLYDFYRQRPS